MLHYLCLESNIWIGINRNSDILVNIRYLLCKRPRYLRRVMVHRLKLEKYVHVAPFRVENKTALFTVFKSMIAFYNGGCYLVLKLLL